MLGISLTTNLPYATGKRAKRPHNFGNLTDRELVLIFRTLENPDTAKPFGLTQIARVAGTSNGWPNAVLEGKKAPNQSAHKRLVEMLKLLEQLPKQMRQIDEFMEARAERKPTDNGRPSRHVSTRDMFPSDVPASTAMAEALGAANEVAEAVTSPESSPTLPDPGVNVAEAILSEGAASGTITLPGAMSEQTEAVDAEYEPELETASQDVDAGLDYTASRRGLTVNEAIARVDKALALEMLPPVEVIAPKPTNNKSSMMRFAEAYDSVMGDFMRNVERMEQLAEVAPPMFKPAVLKVRDELSDMLLNIER